MIVPVKDGGRYLAKTLPALRAALRPGDELLVSDDGSSDDSAALAAAAGARVLSDPVNRGPAVARNRAAREATRPVLAFLDADVRVHAGTLDVLRRALEDDSVAAAFGSYDASPESRSYVSLYKNLAHHFVHQRSAGTSSSFWAGCGAIRTEAFRRLGGFDESYRRASIEDVELGYRLRECGLRVRLVPEAQVTHLKEWTLRSWLRADLVDRAVPWARLLAAGRGLPRDLNFTWRDRAASALTACGLACLPAALWDVRATAVAAAAFAVALALDAPFLAFAARSVSLPFAVAAAGLQLLHRSVGLVGLALGLATRRPKVATARTTT